MISSTSTDPSAKESWRITDPVIRLRERGGDRVYGLPDLPVEWTLGSAATCQLQLRDHTKQISREHAKLVPFAGGWKLHDLSSKNGLWCDGVRRLEITLTPGLEIGIGGLSLVAESRQLIALHALLCRLLGWSALRWADIDEALRSLRDWAALRVALVLMGDGDLVTVARRLHTATLGADVPFVAIDARASGMTALQAVGHGTLWAPELPPDFAAVAASLREMDTRTRLMLHAQSAEDAANAAITLARPAILALPSFTSRPEELERIIQECADDAAASLGAPATGFTMLDHDVLARLEFGEARAASALNDPNVVKIHDTGRLDDGRPVLIMELVDGPSLQAMIETRSPLPIDTIGQLMIQAASALHAAHARSIIHRDIKPSNLLVTSRWGRAAFLVVVDFGIAKLGDPQLAGKIRTRTKTFIGTPGFVAPEQALGRPIDAKADLYALGVVLYYALTGRLPYQADSELATLNLQITGAPFRAPIELRPDTPPAWNALVVDCLQLERARRPTAVEFGHRIASALENGELLLQALAPSIAVHRGPAGANAPTLSSDVPTALSQLGAAARAAPRAATRDRARLALVAAAAGAVLGCVATVLAMRLTSPAAPEAPRDEPRTCSRMPESQLPAGCTGHVQQRPTLLRTDAHLRSDHEHLRAVHSREAECLQRSDACM